MTTTITTGATVITPTIVLGYEESREAQSIVHPILGSTTPDVTLRPAVLRTGRLSCGFSGATSETLSKSAADTLAGASTFALADTDRATVAMTFVVPQGSQVTRTLEDETRNAWVVSFDFQEV